MALTVQSLSQSFASTQQYLVTGTVGDLLNAVIDDPSIASVSPAGGTLTASGILFTVVRVGLSGGACTLKFTDTTDGETEPVTVNLSGDPVSVPAIVTGYVGQTISVTISELNDPNAFASITVLDSTVAQITTSSNAEGTAVLSVSLLKNGTTSINVDDGHGGLLSVQVLVGAAPPVKNVTLNQIEAVIGGQLVKTGQAVIALSDSNTGYNQSGGYTISLTQSGQYIVTYGIPPAESTTQINVAAAVITPQGNVFLSDGRTLQVTVQAVNSTITAEQNADGSYLSDSVVTTRTLGADVLAMFGTITSGSTEPPSPHQGQLFFNTTTNNFEVFENGAWVIIASVGSAATLAGLGDVKITSPSDTQVLSYVAADGKWENVTLASSDTLAADTDVSISSPADGQVLTYVASATKWENRSLPSDTDSLSALTDVTLASPADGDVLTYVSSASKWENKPADSDALANDSDVSIVSPADGQILTYDAASGKWKNKANAGTGTGTVYSIAFNSTATGTNFEPNGVNPSSYFAATTTIACPSTKLLRFRFIADPSSSSAGYVGLAFQKAGGSGGVWFAGFQMNGFVACYNPSSITGTAATMGGYQNASTGIGRREFFEIILSVQDSANLFVSATCMGVSFINMQSNDNYITNIDLTGNIQVYAIGAAASDIVLCQYETTLF